MKKILALVLVCMFALTGMAMAETLKMGTNAAFPPYEFYDDETGAIVGIDAEVAAAIAEKLGYELEIVDMDFDSLIPAVANGKVDMVLAGLTVTEERKQNVDFTTSYATGVQVVIVKEDSEITVDALFAEGASHKIGVQQGTTGDMFYASVTDVFEAKEVKRYKSAVDATADMALGRVDCVIIDELPAKKIAENNADSMICYDAGWEPENYAIAVQKGSDLLPVINKVLERLIAEGKIDEYLLNHTAA